MTVRIYLALATALLAACLEWGSAQPKRPASVPANAFWCGGADGGVFVALSAEGKAGRYTGTIYTEAGDIWYRGPFRMDPKHPGKPPRRGTSWCGGWDGTRLHLAAGGALIATEADNQMVR